MLHRYRQQSIYNLNKTNSLVFHVQSNLLANLSHWKLPTTIIFCSVFVRSSVGSRKKAQKQPMHLIGNANYEWTLWFSNISNGIGLCDSCNQLVDLIFVKATVGEREREKKWHDQMADGFSKGQFRNNGIQRTHTHTVSGKNHQFKFIAFQIKSNRSTFICVL